MQPETKFKYKVQADLKTIDDVWVVKTQNKALRGTPDILGCINGWFFALELKSKKMKASKLQQYNLDKINQAGGVALVTYPSNWPAVKKIIKALGEKKR